MPILKKPGEKKQCEKGFSCGASCVSRTKSCVEQLTSQFSTQAAGWLKNNQRTVKDLVVNTGGLVGSVIGGKIGGTTGALAGDLIGAMITRNAVIVGEAAIKAKQRLSSDQAYQRASRIQQISRFTRATMSELADRRFQDAIGDDLTGDITGWAIGNTAARLISQVPGIGGLPFKGATVAMIAVPRIVQARRNLQIARGERDMSLLQERLTLVFESGQIPTPSLFQERLEFAKTADADVPSELANQILEEAGVESEAPAGEQQPTQDASVAPVDEPTPPPPTVTEAPFNKYDELRAEVEATRRDLMDAIAPTLAEQDEIVVEAVTDFDLDGQDFIGLLDTDKGTYSFRIYRDREELKLSYQPVPPEVEARAKEGLTQAPAEEVPVEAEKTPDQPATPESQDAKSEQTPKEAVEMGEFSPVKDSEVLKIVRAILSDETGADLTVFDVLFDPEEDTFRGRAQQKIAANQSQYYSFQISPENIVYKLTNPDEVIKFAATDEGWTAIVEFAAKKGKTLTCKPGNVQCGGKCQKGTMNCWAGMSPQQKKAAQLAAKKAKAAPTTDEKPTAKKTNPDTSGKLDFSKPPRSEAEYKTATDQWLKERGYEKNIMYYHDMGHQTLHTMIGMNSEQIAAKMGLDGPGPVGVEEVLLTAMGSAIIPRSDGSFRSKQELRSGARQQLAVIGKDYPIGNGAEDLIDQVIDGVLSHPHRDEYSTLLQTFNTRLRSFATS